MSVEKDVKAVTICQIQDALEERQNLDRRQKNKGVPENVSQERRKNDRRSSKARD